MSRSRVLIALILCLGIVGLALWRGGFLRKSVTSGEVFSRARSEGVKSYASLSMRELDSSLDIDGFTTLLAIGEHFGKPNAQGATLDALHREVATFLHLRFIVQDCDQYVSWRVSSGCTFKTVHEMEQTWGVISGFEEVCRRPPPANATIQELMQAYWTAAPALHNGANAPRAISSDPRGINITIATLRTPYEQRVHLEGSLGKLLWHGPVSSTMRGWFDLPSDPGTIAKSREGLDIAEVGVILEFSDGSRRPLVLAYYFDPTRKRWVLRYVNQNNFDPRLLSCLEY